MRWAKWFCGWFALLALPLIADAALPPLRMETFHPETGGSGEWFGAAVAVDGDTAVVGAHQSSAVYVFERENGVWRKQATLAGTGGLFGSAVDVDGDTVVVAAPLEAHNGVASGAVYVYTRSNGDWSRTSKLVASDAAAGSWFGSAVALDGDTILVGARDHLRTGAAYVFTGGDGSWHETAMLTPDGPSREFGVAVDLDAGTALIGARGENGGRGAAYVFSGDESGWQQTARLAAQDTALGDNFGFPVVLNAGTALIGAMEQGQEQDYWGTGAAYAFAFIHGAWRQQAKLTAEDAAAGDLFGRSLALQGNVALIGAIGVDDQQNKGGAAYVFNRTGESWSQHAKLLPAHGSIHGTFGTAVAIDGDVGLVGAPLADTTGAAYLYQLDPPRPRLQCPGDVNGDGMADLVVVTPGGSVTVKGVDGAFVNQFQLDDSKVIVDTAILPDTNANGSPELLALSDVPVVEVRDLLSSGGLGIVELLPWQIGWNLYVMPDVSGNGVPEFVTLGWSPGRPRDVPSVNIIEVHDGLTGETYAQGQMGSIVKDLTLLPDADGDSEPELVLLVEGLRPGWADKLDVTGLPGSGPVRNVWLGRNWRMIREAQIADMNGNGVPEQAVLRTGNGAVNVQIRDPLKGSYVGFVGFGRRYLPIEFLALADRNGNGADELALLGWHQSGRNQQLVIKDSRSGQKLAQAWLDPAFPARDMTTCGDLDGDGSGELAVLGQRRGDGAISVVVANGVTAEPIATVAF